MYIYSSYVMHAFSHGGYIYCINVYGVVMHLFTHTTIWIKVPLMPQIYTMLQEALLFNLQTMIHDLSILLNAQDSTART